MYLHDVFLAIALFKDQIESMLTKLHEQQILFFTYVFLWMILFGLIYNIFKIVLARIGCVNTDSKITKSRSMTSQWLLISSIVTTFLGISPLLKHGYFVNHITCDILNNTDIIQSIPVLSIFVAYLWYDLIFNQISTMYKFHHLICSLSVVWVISIGHSAGVMFSEILLIAEISTIFLNLKMITTGFVKNMISLLFMITFIIFRSMYMPNVLLKMFECFSYDLSYIVIITIFTSVMIINYYWTVLIIGKVFTTCLKLKPNKDIYYEISL